MTQSQNEIKMPHVTTAERIGFEIGQWEKALEIAQNLLPLKILTGDQIANAVGLPLEEVHRLRETKAKES
jgi:hypothetical protein